MCAKQNGLIIKNIKLYALPPEAKKLERYTFARFLICL